MNTILLALVLAPLQTPGVAPSAEEAKPIQAGTQVPNVTVNTVTNKPVKLREAVAKKPAVVIFYRGGWCPFCNVHLAKLKDIEGDLDKLGYQILAISPDKPSELAKSVEKNKLSYQLLSDSSAEAMKGFGVAWQMPTELVQTYKKNYKLDVEERMGATHHILPVPSVFVVGKDQKVKFVYANADYRVRLEPAKVLEAAKAAK
jgi:peroxiredoxin